MFCIFQHFPGLAAFLCDGNFASNSHFPIHVVRLLFPELLLSAVGLLLLAADALLKKSKNVSLFLSISGCLGALFYLLACPVSGYAFNMVAVDPFAIFFKILALCGCLATLLISENDDRLLGDQAGTYCALLIFSVVGTMFLSSAQDLLLFFIALELTTIPLFILTGFLRRDNASTEGALKFFLIGAFSAGLTLYGISYVYGLCGSTNFVDISDWFAMHQGQPHILFFLGILFLFVGMGFKFSLFPFHQWTPDAYQGAPTAVTAFFSVSREAGIVAFILRFFVTVVPMDAAGLSSLFMILSVLTMFVGNLSALKQNNLKRLLAYSSIAHAGTIFIGLVANNALGQEGVMLYSLNYMLMSFGAFAIISTITRLKNSEDISVLRGLSKDHLPLALLLVVCLLSLAGIPPLLGFWGKFYVFYAAIQSKMYALVILGLVNAVIAVYYYFRMIHMMFFEPAIASVKVERYADRSAQLVSIFAAAALIIYGIFPGPILTWIKSSLQFLP